MIMVLTVLAYLSVFQIQLICDNLAQNPFNVPLNVLFADVMCSLGVVSLPPHHIAQHSRLPLLSS